jgi:hypothetical protein
MRTLLNLFANPAKLWVSGQLRVCSKTVADTPRKCGPVCSPFVSAQTSTLHDAGLTQPEHSCNRSQNPLLQLSQSQGIHPEGRGERKLVGVTAVSTCNRQAACNGCVGKWMCSPHPGPPPPGRRCAVWLQACRAPGHGAVGPLPPLCTRRVMSPAWCRVPFSGVASLKRPYYCNCALCVISERRPLWVARSHHPVATASCPLHNPTYVPSWGPEPTRVCSVTYKS